MIDKGHCKIVFDEAWIIFMILKASPTMVLRKWLDKMRNTQRLRRLPLRRSMISIQTASTNSAYPLIEYSDTVHDPAIIARLSTYIPLQLDMLR